eukprot:Tbor_TRINITY_DN5396_c0_g1::TRINITY_DN5396_c0_g1_i14::g.4634::m.4634
MANPNKFTRVMGIIFPVLLLGYLTIVQFRYTTDIPPVTTINLNIVANKDTPIQTPLTTNNNINNIYHLKPIPTLITRAEIPFILERENMSIGVEIGVDKGGFAAHTLKKWPSCKEYHLVDIWKKQKNYVDFFNENDTVQEYKFRKAKKKLKQWLKSEGGQDKVRICRNLSTICAKQYTDMYFDYIYVDARHDYKGVLDDIVHWWPKLKKGGIMAGHDYVIYEEIEKREHTKHKLKMGRHQDWRINYDGTINNGRVVRGAVDDFFMPSAALPIMPATAASLSQAPRAPINILSFDVEYERQVIVTYKEIDPSWVVRK